MHKIQIIKGGSPMKKNFKKLVALSVAAMLLTGCKKTSPDLGETGNTEKVKTSNSVSSEGDGDSAGVSKYAGKSADEILASLTTEQKVSQMLQPAVYMVTPEMMQDQCYGSLLSKLETVSYSDWQDIVDSYQEAALASDSGIPYLFGQDDVHGVNYATNTVIFPHNIGMGAANDPELMYQIGLITADEAKLCHMLWDFSPCVAQSVDPRWGRTYESYGADLNIIKSLSGEYVRGLQDGGLVACGKHFLADGNVKFGTGENSDANRLIDRGDAELTDEEINELLSVYQNLIDKGVQTIMISHSSLNGVKMHENKKYIDYLKNEMGFKGFIVSDWNSVQNTSGGTYKEQLINAVNSGIDMLMEVESFDQAKIYILEAIDEGSISEERIDDAVRRILQVKIDEGIMDDPFCKNMKTTMESTGSSEYRKVAERAVEESLVLLKNDNNILPLKKGSKVYITGPAANNAQVQCGGWTIDWNKSPNVGIDGVTTIQNGMKQVFPNKDIELITEPSRAEEADVIVLVLGEESYAEWNGDTEDLSITGALGMRANEGMIKKVKEYNKPVVTLIVAGRQVLIKDYIDSWDAVVMCYLPGSEGQGVANVLCGNADFKGKLPSPWYGSVDEIGSGKFWLDIGYGLSYSE